MVKITEDYCSKEVYRLLVKKGFDGEIHTTFDEEGYTQPSITLQIAMKWLREVHNIAIDTEWEHLWYAYVKPMTANPFEDDYYQCYSAKHEEAVDAAIKYCLENLI